MRVYWGIALLLAFSFVVGGCAPSEEPSEPPEVVATQALDIAAINSLRDQYSAALNAGDAAALAGLWTDEGVFMPPNAPAASGKAAIQNAYQNQFGQFTQSVTVSSEELEVAGDWAFDRGSYSQTLTPKPEGEPITDNGKYLVIVRRLPDGSWKVARLIFNSNEPLAGNGE